MNTRLLPLAIALACAATLPAAAHAKSPAKATAAHATADQRFLQKADTGSAKEVATAQYVVEHAATAPVRDYATRLVTDHTAMRAKVAATASTVGVSLSAGKGKGDMHKNENGMTSAERTGTDASILKDDPAFRALAAHKGADLDHAYVEAMVADHKKDVAEFVRASNDKSLSAPVRALATGALPTLRQHLAGAQKLRTIR